jgi:hypothetical protein
MTNYQKALIADKLKPKRCFDFILACFEEIKILIKENDICEIKNIDYASISNMMQPYSVIQFEDEEIKLFITKSTVFGSGKEALACKHYARWKNSKDKVIELEINRSDVVND